MTIQYQLYDMEEALDLLCTFDIFEDDEKCEECEVTSVELSVVDPLAGSIAIPLPASDSLKEHLALIVLERQ